MPLPGRALFGGYHNLDPLTAFALLAFNDNHDNADFLAATRLGCALCPATILRANFLRDCVAVGGDLDRAGRRLNRRGEVRRDSRAGSQRRQEKG